MKIIEKILKRVHRHFGIESVGYQRVFTIFFIPATLIFIIAIAEWRHLDDGFFIFWFAYIFTFILPYPIRWVNDGFKIDDSKNLMIYKYFGIKNTGFQRLFMLLFTPFTLLFLWITFFLLTSPYTWIHNYVGLWLTYIGFLIFPYLLRFNRPLEKLFKHFGIKNLRYQRIFAIFFILPVLSFILIILGTAITGELQDIINGNITDKHKASAYGSILMLICGYLFLFILPYLVRWIKDGFKIDDIK